MGLSARLLSDHLDPDPQIAVEPASHRPGASPSEWLFAWEITNLGSEPLQVHGAWIPHGRFRGDRRELDPKAALPGGQSARIELPVRCAEPPGTVVENAFLILNVGWRHEPWRIFVRLRITFDGDGVPADTVELITVQRVGFSR